MKNVLILGDSYSTFRGYIPEGYKTYYPKFDVHSVTDTWWNKLSSRLDLNITENNSWSGSTVSYTGREGDCSSSSSFIYRFDCLAERGFLTENAVDTVIIFGATNDSWIDVPLGELKYGDISRDELFSILPAISALFARVRAALPKGKIVCVINTELKPEIAEAFIEVSHRYGALPVVLRSIDKESGHPTALGMSEIAEQIAEAIDGEN